MNINFTFLTPLSMALIITILISLSACGERNTTLLVKDSTTPLAQERIGLDGEYDASGLAKRVAKALAEDSILSGISTIYVAQNDSNIILKGTISERNFLDRLMTVAQSVQGVGEVDVSQVQIR